MMRSNRQVLLVGCLALAAVSSGCGGKKIWVQHYPEFYDPSIKTVAVAPFENRSPQVGAGGIVADRLAGALDRNGTYRVVGPREVAQLAGENAEAVPPKVIAPDAVLVKLRERGDVQALITGSVDAFSAFQTGYIEYDYGYGYGYYGRYGWPYYGDPWYDGWGYRFPRIAYDTRARARLTARMLRVSDGAVLATTPAPVQAVVGVDRYAPIDPGAVMDRAVDRAVDDLLRRFAVTPIRIKVDSDDDLKTASRKQGGRWDWEKTFHAADDRMYVVVRLPSAAARNTFRVAIARKGREENAVAEQEFVWSPAVARDGLVFSPRQLAQAGGIGTYRVNFYANGERVMKHTFKIKE